MTTLFMDGFDHYGINTNLANSQPALNMLDGTWAAINTPQSMGPNTPSFGARTGVAAIISAQSGGEYRYVLPATQSNLFLSFGYAVKQLPSGNNANQVIIFRNGSNVDMLRLHVQSTGTLVLTDATNAVLGTTQGPVIVPQNWHFFEMNYNQGTGVFTLRLDDATGAGTPIMNVTGLSTAVVAQLALNVCINDPTVTTAWMDDLFIRNGSGSINNSWLGDRRIATLFTNSDTATAGWTPNYYKEFGPGILTLGSKVPNISTVQNPDCGLSAVASTQLDIGASDFTLETMVRWDALPATTGYSTIFGRWNTVTPALSYRLILGGSSFNNSCIQFDTSTDGTAGTLATPIIFPWTPQLNVWYHIALVRASSQLLLFVNGQQFGLPIADARTYFGGSTAQLTVGTQQGINALTPTTNSGIAGRLDETRFTNGFARYTGPFTPPVAAFPRGSVADPHWTSVALLMGYDSNPAVDESSFTRAISTILSTGSLVPPSVFFPGDGPLVGAFSTNNKAVPDDNTYISAPFVAATNILTMTTQPANGNTITLGTKDGTTPAVYTFKTAITTAFDVLIDTTAQNTLINFLNAVNAGTGAGTKYGTATTANFDVNAVTLPVGQIEVIANISGTGGNSIVSTRTGTAASWASTTLLGGLNIPGPSEFKFQRPPNNTTIISALQTNARALKTDAGLATIQTTLIGPLGGTTAGASHGLTTSPSYYLDIVELDPDTGAGLTPTTIINGKIEINRTV